MVNLASEEASSLASINGNQTLAESQARIGRCRPGTGKEQVKSAAIRMLSKTESRP